MVAGRRHYPSGHALEADPDQQQGLLHPSEVELDDTIKLIMDKIDQEKPARLVIDALTELRLLAEDPFNYRRQILTLKRFFSERDCTVLALDDLTETVPAAPAQRRPWCV